MTPPMSDDEWKQVFRELLEKNPGEDRALYLQVTRGAYPVRDLTIKQQDIESVIREMYARSHAKSEA